MRTEQRTIYIAKDETEHKTEVDALAHEAEIDIRAWCDAELYEGITCRETSDAMIEKFEKIAPLVENLHKAKTAQKRYANSGRA